MPFSDLTGLFKKKVNHFNSYLCRRLNCSLKNDTNSELWLLNIFLHWLEKEPQCRLRGRWKVPTRLSQALANIKIKASKTQAINPIVLKDPLEHSHSDKDDLATTEKTDKCLNIQADEKQVQHIKVGLTITQARNLTGHRETTQHRHYQNKTWNTMKKLIWQQSDLR